VNISFLKFLGRYCPRKIIRERNCVTSNGLVEKFLQKNLHVRDLISFNPLAWLLLNHASSESGTVSVTP